MTLDEYAKRFNKVENAIYNKYMKDKVYIATTDECGNVKHASRIVNIKVDNACDI